MRTHSKSELNNVFDFSKMKSFGLPKAWQLAVPVKNAPLFRLVKKYGRTMLMAAGSGCDNCYGYIHTPVKLKPGSTYCLKTRFKISRGLNPQRHLRFAVFAKNEFSFNNGIFDFFRLPGGWIEGRNTFLFTCKKTMPIELRIFYFFNASGKAFIKDISITECSPVPSRMVRVAATEGKTNLAGWSKALDEAGKNNVDLVLLPETIRGHVKETLNGPTANMLSKKAKQYKMYVTGGLCLQDKKTKSVYSTALLYDRTGKLSGRYDKYHPFTPECWGKVAISPGQTVPVFKTDFGTIGISICFDNWFTDVAELLALKGAEIILLPNVGYCRGIMPARASDNNVRFVASSQVNPLGVWDTAGRDITRPNADPTNLCNCPLSKTAGNIRKLKTDHIKMLIATLDLSQSPSPHNWGGPMLSAPGGRRNRREQIGLLYDKIKKEQNRWWN